MFFVYKIRGIVMFAEKRSVKDLPDGAELILASNNREPVQRKYDQELKIQREKNKDA